MPQTRARHDTAVASKSGSKSSKQKSPARDPTPAVENVPAEASLLVSTRFNPEEYDMLDTDLILVSQDEVYFYAHRATLLRDSSNDFASLLPEPLGGSHLEVDVFQPMADADFWLPSIPVIMEYPSD
ncbi:hypothetical protein FRC07_010609, partial [Ceratobasidium sp. 392]